MKRFILAATVASLTVLPAALATHQPMGRCEAPNGGLGMVEVTTGDPRATFYVDDRNSVTGYGTWVYMEANGEWTSHGGPGLFGDDVTRHNLQRGGSSPFLPDDIETCVDGAKFGPDLLVL